MKYRVFRTYQVDPIVKEVFVEANSYEEACEKADPEFDKMEDIDLEEELSMQEEVEIVEEEKEN